MSGGFPGMGDGEGLGIRDGGVSGGSQEDFRRGECRGGCPGHPRVKMNIDIVL